MKSNNSTIRPLGQRAIPSSFVFPSSNRAQLLESGERSEDGTANSRVSLSDFLNNKLQKTAARSRSVKGKSQPFLSPLGRKTDSCNSGGRSKNESKLEDKERKSEVDQVIFQQFKKPAVGENGNGIDSRRDGPATATGSGADSSNSPTLQSRIVGEWGTSESEYLQGRGLQARKQKHPVAPKQPLVVGNAEPAQERVGGKKKRRKLYNHYANGHGWWDCDMEGFDTEEVGFGEVWEGVGSSTLGGIEWH
ncbi:hypothetical protein LINGRAHAP2_LOCUS10883 [Linum grandiflorum]